jgi:hypothetical protein
MNEIYYDFFHRFKNITEVYHIIDDNMFVHPNNIEDFKEKKKVLIKKIPINQYRFEVEVIAEKVEKPKKNNKNK